MAAVGLSGFLSLAVIFIISMQTFYRSVHAQNHNTTSPSIASPSKIPLNVGVPWKTEFTEFVSVPKSGTNFTGFCVEVFEAAIDKDKYSVQYIPVGDGSTQPNYNDLIMNLSKGYFNAVVGDVTITAKRFQEVIFTEPFLDAGLVAVVRLMNDDHIISGFTFLKPFSATMWILTLLFFITGGVVLYLLERRRNSPKKVLGSIVWFSFSAFSNQDDIKTVMGRIVVITWLIVTGILYSCYTANLSANLTAPRLHPNLNDIQSVVQSQLKIGVQNGSFAQKYLAENAEDSLRISYQRLKALDTEADYYNALFNGTVGAIIDERPYMDSLVANHCGNLTFAGKPFTIQNWGFVSDSNMEPLFDFSLKQSNIHEIYYSRPSFFYFRFFYYLISFRSAASGQAFHHDYSDLAHSISEKILELSENGKLQSIRKQWLPYYDEDCTGDSPSGSGQIQVYHLWGLFVVAGLVTVIALLIYMAQWKWNALRESQQTPPQGRELGTIL